MIGGGANRASVSLFSSHTSVIFITQVCLCVDICPCTVCTSVFVPVNVYMHGHLLTVRTERPDIV